MKPSRLVAVDHINLVAPPGLESSLRDFYVEVCCLEEITAHSQQTANLSFRSAGLELRIRMTVNPEIDPVRRRLTVAVPSLAAAAERLAERAIEHDAISGFTYTDRRIATIDPVGHRVELKQEWPEAPL